MENDFGYNVKRVFILVFDHEKYFVLAVVPPDFSVRARIFFAHRKG